MKVRWLLFWYLVPQLAAAGIAAATHRTDWLGDQAVVLGITVLPLGGFLLWTTYRRGGGWIGPLRPAQWRGWLPLAGLLAGGYLLLVSGGEPWWARLWEPPLRSLGIGPAVPPVRPAASWGEAFAITVLAVAATPLAEEALFRGALLRLWNRWWGPAAAVAATALLFGFLHAQAQIFKVVLGGGLAVLTLRSRSLVPAVTTHVAVNAVGMAALLGSGDAGAADAGPSEPVDPGVCAFLVLAGLGLLTAFAWRLARRNHPRPAPRLPRAVGRPRRSHRKPRRPGIRGLARRRAIS